MMVIPKSGCNNNNVEIKIIDTIDHMHPGNFVFLTHNDSSQALKITNKGLIISLG